VLQRELERDQRGGSQRGDGDGLAAARDERDHDREDQRGGERDGAAREVVQAPDRERRAAVGLERERAVVERVQAVAEGHGSHGEGAERSVVAEPRGPEEVPDDLLLRHDAASDKDREYDGRREQCDARPKTTAHTSLLGVSPLKKVLRL